MDNNAVTFQMESRRSSIEDQRRVLMHWLLVLTGVFTFGFGLLNLYRGVILLGFLELAVAVFAATLIFVIPRARNTKAWCLIYIVVLFGMLMAALLTPGLSDKVFVWFFLLPALAHFILGRHLGLILTLILLMVAWFVYYHAHYQDPTLLDIVGLTNVVACSLVLTGGVYAYEFSREQAEDRLHRMAATDSLTGLANRKHLRDLLDFTLEHARRTDTSFSILELDLDHFKSINDQYGHDVGDQVLKAVARAMTQRLRSTDTPARWGGEEFMILLPGTNAEGAQKVAEVIRQTLAALEVRANGEPLSITTSIGIAEFPSDGNSTRELLLLADERLYAAKNAGRDRIVTA